MIFNWILFVLFFLFNVSAQARVFGFGDNWVAAYVRGSGATTDVGKEGYANTSGIDTQFRDSVNYAFSGEVGFAFLLTPKFTLRVGLEGYQLKNKSVTGFQAGTSNPYMDVDSQITSVMPGLSAEMVFWMRDTIRFYTLAGINYAKVKVSNSYTVTTAGTTLYTGAPSEFKDAWYSKEVIPYFAGVGFEWYAFDNVTLNLETGWRQFEVPQFYYDQNGTVIRGNAGVATGKGQTVTSNTGKNVQMDFSGPFVGVVFKFYIPPLN